MDTPEANVSLFAFLLHYSWEFLQVPFFADMATAPHWGAVKFCTRATLGDVGTTLVAFWGGGRSVPRLDPSPRTHATTAFVVMGW
jgi:hypothetical protein